MNQQQRRSIPPRATAQYQDRHTTNASIPAITRQVPQQPDEEDVFLPARIPNSAVRYTDEYGNPVIQQGHRRYVMHREPPPRQRQRSGRRIHWIAILGAGMAVMGLLIIICIWIGSAWQQQQLDATYGNPRTYQTDAVVGHGGDSAAHPSHFIFENLRGQVIIIELPAGQIDHAIIYRGPQLFGSDPTGEPVTGSFVTVNGQVDMIINIGNNQSIMYTNNGTKFVPPAGG